VAAALAAFERAVAADPDHGEAREQRRRAQRYLEGEAALAARDWPTAVDRFGQVDAVAPDYPSRDHSASVRLQLYRAELGWGEALLHEGRYAEARLHCGRALDLLQTSAEARACLDAAAAALPPTA
jgi:tetratricopeptide (TPR) repeat protein